MANSEVRVFVYPAQKLLRGWEEGASGSHAARVGRYSLRDTHAGQRLEKAGAQLGRGRRPLLPHKLDSHTDKTELADTEWRGRGADAREGVAGRQGTANQVILEGWAGSSQRVWEAEAVAWF